MAAWLAAALLLLSAVAVSAEPVTDGFKGDTLGPRWNPRFVTPGRVSVQREVVHSGAAALRVEILGSGSISATASGSACTGTG